jgi:hypothetical protein
VIQPPPFDGILSLARPKPGTVWHYRGHVGWACVVLSPFAVNEHSSVCAGFCFELDCTDISAVDGESAGNGE